MKSAKKKEAVWKDTNKYPFSIRYDYPLSIRSRCLFFYADTLKGWKAVMNLADKLAIPNKICVVYLFGEAKQELIMKHFDKLNNPNLIILWADYISKTQFEIVNEAISTIDKIKKWGVQPSECSEIAEIFNFDYESILRTYHFSEEECRLITRGRNESESIKKEISTKGYKNLTNCRIIRGAIGEHCENLFGVLRGIYPYGAERDTSVEYAYKVLHFEKWCACGEERKLNGIGKLGVSYKDYSEQYEQLTLFDNTSWGIKEFVNEFHRICDRGIEKNGYFNLIQIIQEMMKPPYGMCENNYYGLCLGIAMRKYKTGYFVGFLLQSKKAEESNMAQLATYAIRSFSDKNPKGIYVYTQSEKQIYLAQRLFNVFNPEFKFNSNCICLENVLVCVRDYIQKNVHYDTVQRTMPELFEIVGLWEPTVYSKETEKYADWISRTNENMIKDKIRRVDDDFLRSLSEKYGEQKKQLYRKSQYVDGGAVGWLHSTEMVDERVEEYMKDIVCRECGAPILQFYDVFENNDFTSRKKKRLTKQNLINLNKKMLGRYQTEFFCLSCLCEALNITEWDLCEKMQEFKNQGCELF